MVAAGGYQPLPLSQTRCFLRANGKKGGGEKQNGKKRLLLLCWFLEGTNVDLPVPSALPPQHQPLLFSDVLQRSQKLLTRVRFCLAGLI